MNDRLKELMLAHGLHRNISEDCQHRMEMLTELIIKECIKVIHEQERIPAGYLYAKPAHILELAIKEHFGVNNETIV